MIVGSKDHVDTLVVCMDDNHRHEVIEALRMPAQYETISSALTGNRFNKIIVLLGQSAPWSPVEIEEYGRIIKEYLPTKLAIGGKLYVI